MFLIPVAYVGYNIWERKKREEEAAAAAAAVKRLQEPADDSMESREKEEISTDEEDATAATNALSEEDFMMSNEEESDTSSEKGSARSESDDGEQQDADTNTGLDGQLILEQENNCMPSQNRAMYELRLRQKQKSQRSRDLLHQSIQGVTAFLKEQQQFLKEKQSQWGGQKI